MPILRQVRKGVMVPSESADRWICNCYRDALEPGQVTMLSRERDPSVGREICGKTDTSAEIQGAVILFAGSKLGALQHSDDPPRVTPECFRVAICRIKLRDHHCNPRPCLRRSRSGNAVVVK